MADSILFDKIVGQIKAVKSSIVEPDSLPAFRLQGFHEHLETLVSDASEV